MTCQISTLRWILACFEQRQVKSQFYPAFIGLFGWPYKPIHKISRLICCKKKLFKRLLIQANRRARNIRHIRNVLGRDDEGVGKQGKRALAGRSSTSVRHIWSLAWRYSGTRVSDHGSWIHRPRNLSMLRPYTAVLCPAVTFPPIVGVPMHAISTIARVGIHMMAGVKGDFSRKKILKKE